MGLSLTPSLNTSTLPATFPAKRDCKIKTFTCRATRLSTARGSNFYQVLALESENVGVNAIKIAYRRMARRYHPDACPPSEREECTRMFIELQSAYETLSNPVLREKYDYHLGLAEPSFERMRRVEGDKGFHREVWVDQLRELEGRSNMRVAKKRQ